MGEKWVWSGQLPVKIFTKAVQQSLMAWKQMDIAL